MDISDYCFLGNKFFGNTLVKKLEKLGIENKWEVDGFNERYIYYIWKNKNKLEISGDNKDSSFGKHILSTRKIIDINNWQKFSKELDSKDNIETFKTLKNMSKIKIFTDEVLDEVVRLYNSGYKIEEIASTLHLKETSLTQKICELRKSGKIIGYNKDKRVENKESQNEVKEENKKRYLSDFDKVRLDLAKTFVATMLYNKTSLTDNKLAKKAINIADELINNL